jgi:hypothetical protein
MNPQPLPKDNDALSPWQREDHIGTLRAAAPMLKHSVEELAGQALERHGVSPELPDAVVAAYGWASCQYELGILVTQRLQEVEDMAQRDGITPAEAMFRVANTTKFRHADSRVSKLRKEVELWAAALVALATTRTPNT